MKDLYDKIYSEYENYNIRQHYKDKYIDAFLDKGKYHDIVDLGCGVGNNLKRLYDSGYNIVGVEWSSICCDKYLKGYPHINSDIYDYCAHLNKKHDAVICTDVLEHIEPSMISTLINKISAISDNALFIIANHSDIKVGEEIHLIQKDVKWWVALLNHSYNFVDVIDILTNGKCFVIECHI